MISTAVSNRNSCFAGSKLESWETGSGLGTAEDPMFATYSCLASNSWNVLRGGVLDGTRRGLEPEEETTPGRKSLSIAATVGVEKKRNERGSRVSFPSGQFVFSESEQQPASSHAVKALKRYGPTNVAAGTKPEASFEKPHEKNTRTADISCIFKGAAAGLRGRVGLDLLLDSSANVGQERCLMARIAENMRKRSGKECESGILSQRSGPDTIKILTEFVVQC